MSDLVERVMAQAAFNESTWSFETTRILREAAAELQRLRAEKEPCPTCKAPSREECKYRNDPVGCDHPEAEKEAKALVGEFPGLKAENERLKWMFHTAETNLARTLTHLDIIGAKLSRYESQSTESPAAVVSEGMLDEVNKFYQNYNAEHLESLKVTLEKYGPHFARARIAELEEALEQIDRRNNAEWRTDPQIDAIIKRVLKGSALCDKQEGEK